MKRKSLSHSRHFVIILPFKRQLSVFPEIICSFYLPRPGFLSLSTVDVLGWIILCCEWIAGCLMSSLASASGTALPLSCDNQKYFPEKNHWPQLCCACCIDMCISFLT